MTVKKVRISQRYYRKRAHANAFHFKEEDVKTKISHHQQTMFVHVYPESLPLAAPFRISRGAKESAEVVVVEVHHDGRRGVGESLPYARYGESQASVVREIEAVKPQLDIDGDLISKMSAGAARNALDCALWDLKNQLENRPVAMSPKPLIRTITVGAPESCAQAANKFNGQDIKLKLGGDGDDAERIQVTRQHAPNSRIALDANESWTLKQYERLLPIALDANVFLIEQPFPQDADELLSELDRPIPICADESFHDDQSFAAINGRYDAINIKLDKSGGIHEAIRNLQEAKRRHLLVMIGSMVASSYSIIPALHLASFGGDIFDLDGAIFLKSDRENGVRYLDGQIHPPI